MSKANASPEGFRGVIPMLVCRDGASEIDYCKTAFGAEEVSRRASPDGTVLHATLAIGGAMVMIHGEYPTLGSRAPESDGSSPVVIYLYVEHVDSVIERAVAAGAKVLIPAADQVWGDRVGRIVDPSGHVWNVASRAQEALSDPPTSAKVSETDS
jgi:PhnB protein